MNSLPIILAFAQVKDEVHIHQHSYVQCCTLHLLMSKCMTMQAHQLLTGAS